MPCSVTQEEKDYYAIRCTGEGEPPRSTEEFQALLSDIFIDTSEIIQMRILALLLGKEPLAVKLLHVEKFLLHRYVEVVMGLSLQHGNIIKNSSEVDVNDAIVAELEARIHEKYKVS